MGFSAGPFKHWCRAKLHGLAVFAKKKRPWESLAACLLKCSANAERSQNQSRGRVYFHRTLRLVLVRLWGLALR